jgi:hypothetical protein
VGVAAVREKPPLEEVEALVEGSRQTGTVVSTAKATREGVDKGEKGAEGKVEGGNVVKEAGEGKKLALGRGGATGPLVKKQKNQFIEFKLRQASYARACVKDGASDLELMSGGAHGGSLGDGDRRRA